MKSLKLATDCRICFPLVFPSHLNLSISKAEISLTLYEISCFHAIAVRPPGMTNTPAI